jgi:Flp pilus assembly protein TadD
MRLIIKSGLLVALMALGAANADTRHDAAEVLAESGDTAAMEAAYREILETDPEDIKARLGYATALSWQGKYQQAEVQFASVLEQQPDNLEALIGRGYNFAWNKQFDLAEQQFRQAAELAPDNIGAQKGLGFTYLWSGRPAEALEVFEPLEPIVPDDAELHAAIGQAHLDLNHLDDAEESFQQALILAPGRPDAAGGLALIKGQKKTFDLIAWVGDTSNDGGSGLRELIAGYWFSQDTRLWARYDNSLSLDNPSLARSGEKAETYYLGAFTSIHEHWRGVVELGTRDLPDNADQQVYKLEIINFSDRNVFKLGGQVSPHSDDFTDKLIYGTYGFPVSDNWRLEPALFLSQSGLAEDSEWRAILFAEYASPKRWVAGVSAGGGRIDSDFAETEGSVFTANAQLSYPIGQKNKLNFSVRYEDAPTISYTTVLAGIAIFLP